MAPPPNCFLCGITYVIAREKQRNQFGSGAIADGEPGAKNTSVEEEGTKLEKPAVGLAKNHYIEDLRQLLIFGNRLSIKIL
jgi:hypothetical protein